MWHIGFSTHITKAIALLDESLEAWRQRPLCECPCVILDALYEKVRLDDHVRDAAVFIATEGQALIYKVNGTCWGSLSHSVSTKSTGAHFLRAWSVEECEVCYQSPVMTTLD